mmetsp:Transcript_21077/g.43763  ORF Transcript_21077/g.43763 Transcript_21077/m.43763 type:complete len:219 (-) Transcript_21077:111-767(-)
MSSIFFRGRPRGWRPEASAPALRREPRASRGRQQLPRQHLRERRAHGPGRPGHRTSGLAPGRGAARPGGRLGLLGGPDAGVGPSKVVVGGGLVRRIGEPPHDGILLLVGHPVRVIQVLQLRLFQAVEAPVQPLLLGAGERKGASAVVARKDVVPLTGTVELLATRNIEHSAPDGNENAAVAVRPAVKSSELSQRVRRSLRRYIQVLIQGWSIPPPCRE